MDLLQLSCAGDGITVYIGVVWMLNGCGAGLQKQTCGVLVNGMLNVSEQCVFVTVKGHCILGHMSKSVSSSSREVKMSCCLALVGLHLEKCVQHGTPQVKKQMSSSLWESNGGVRARLLRSTQ